MLPLELTNNEYNEILTLALETSNGKLCVIILPKLKKIIYNFVI